MNTPRAHDNSPAVSPTVSWSSDRSLRIGCAGAADVASVARAVRAAPLPWVIDVVPSARGVQVVVDPLAGDARTFGAVLRACVVIALRDDEENAAAGRTVTIPVRYGEGPDLAEAASRLGISEDELIERHVGRSYTVECVGFSPGFAYLTGVDPSLELPRKETPRPRVPAGSVAIAGSNTAVYPQATPGGWWLIGRTERSMFDVGRTPPALLLVGDVVRFERVD